MLSWPRVGIVPVFILLAGLPAAAQEAFHVAVRGGASIERAEDGLAGTAPAIGASVAMRFARAWRGEVEVWVPGHLEDSARRSRHRDLLLSASAVRLFRAEGIRPFVLAGVSLTRTEDALTHCFADRTATEGPVRTIVSCDEPDVLDVQVEERAGTGLALSLGGGVEIPLGRRLNAIADVRVLLTPGAVLVRPAAGIGFRF